MNGRLVSRWVVVAALVAPLSLALAAPQPATAAAKKKTEKTDTEYKQVAQVKIEIKQESGKVIKTKGNVDFGAQGTLALAGDDHSHSVHVKVDAGESKSDVSITLGYDRDGEAIIAPYSFDTKVKKREVIQIEGGIAIALHITPKKVAVEAPPPEEKPEERDEKLELQGDNNDPLGGL